MRFSEFPFLRYVFFFILGVMSYSFYGVLISLEIIFVSLLFLYALYVILVGINSYRKKYRFKIQLPLLAYLLMFCSGLFFANIKDIRNQPDNLLNNDLVIHSYLATVLSIDETKANSVANRVLVKRVFSNGKAESLTGEVLIYHRSERSLNPGDILLIEGKPQPISGPKNPNEFNYKRFMLRQQIAHQHFIGNQFEVVGRVSERPIEDFFIGIRAKIMAKMDLYFEQSSNAQVAKALLLGQKKNLDKELSEAYSTAGAMHILAVSGLHVGIIYGFFFLFVKPFKLPVSKRVLYLSCIILLIWGYAMLTGMSPSVMRAATMFSLMALAQMKSRSPSIFNAIALSALILLVFDPFLIYAVGFQLSYMALLGILVIQPMLVRLWLPGNRILEYVWQISTVGIAAQLATFPISAYYFHIFPTYFILSNLVVIPGAFLIMTFGVPFMMLAEVPVLSGILAWVTEKLITMVNLIVFRIQDLPVSKISEISLSVWEVGYYGLVLTLFLLLWLYPGKKMATSFLTLLFLGGLLRLSGTFFHHKDKEMFVYALNRGNAIDLMDGFILYYFGDFDTKDYSYSILPNRSMLRPIDSKPLLAFQKEETVKLVAPKIKGDFILQNQHLIFSGLGLDRTVFEWEEGSWKKSELKDTLKLGEKALKIRFK